jgi:hypothetical protein
MRGKGVKYIGLRDKMRWEFMSKMHVGYILSIGTNPLGITSSFVHVGFGV